MGNINERKLVSRILVVAIVLAMVLPLGAVLSMERNNTSNELRETAIISVDHQQIQALEAMGVEIVEPYKNFVLGKVTEKQKNLLEQSGIGIRLVPYFTKIGINKYSFDVREGEPILRDDLKIDSYPLGTGYYIVQFKGPIKEEWKTKLKHLGVEVYGYIPYNAFIVQMDNSMKAKVENLDIVQWIGLYQPAYKIKSKLLDVEGRETVTIFVQRGESVMRIVRMLQYLGAEIEYWNENIAGYGRIIADIDLTLLPDIAHDIAVYFIEPYKDPEVINDYNQWSVQTGVENDRDIWDHGLHGEGQVVGIADSGIKGEHDMFRDPGEDFPYNSTNPNHRKVIRYKCHERADWDQQDDAAEGHGTSTTCTAAGDDSPVGGGSNYDGMALKAKISFSDIGKAGEEEHLYPPYNSSEIWDPAYEDGARVQSASYGSRNTSYYTQSSMDVDMYSWNHKDWLLIDGVGNEEEVPEAVRGDCWTAAKNVVSVGAAVHWYEFIPGLWLATQGQDDLAKFSCLGPTDDGRLKPDIIAPGQFVDTADSNETNPYFQTQGTSSSAPSVAGAAVMVRQYFLEGWYPTGTKVPENSIEPTGALMKAIIVNSGNEVNGELYSDHADDGTYPNNAQGWGRCTIADPLYFDGDSRRLQLIEDDGLFTGQTREYEYYVLNNAEPLKIHLVWTDYPAEPQAIPALVNDLDLTVTAPNGDVYKGNVYSGWSLSESNNNTGNYDKLNNTEGVFLNDDSAKIQVGVWKIRVDAINVPNGPQPFALVVTGALDVGYGTVQSDKGIYSEDDTINIRVEDIGATSPVVVDVISDMDQTGETVSCTETATDSGVFEGSINTAFGNPGENPDGVLQVAHGDTITVSYHDTSPVDHYANVTATVDAESPSITDVCVNDIVTTAANIFWNSDEVADSRVYYGKTEALGLQSYDSSQTVNHKVTLKGLAEDTLYYYDVESTDYLGHATYDDNDGLHYTFKTVPYADILLVMDEDVGRDAEWYITDHELSLNDKGWSYVSWNIIAIGYPVLSDLNKAKVVIWDTAQGYPQLGSNERSVLKPYMDGGGKLYVIGQDIGYDMNPDPEGGDYGGTDINQTWYETYLKAVYKGDSCAEKNSVSGTPAKGNEVCQLIGIGTDQISHDYSSGETPGPQTLDQKVFGPRRFWPDDISGKEAGEIKCWDYDKHLSSESDPGDRAGNRYEGTYRLVYEAWAHQMLGGGWYYDEHAEKGPRDGPPSSVDPIRADILDKSIAWLIGANKPPTITVDYPNGGEPVSGTINIQYTSTDPDAGQKHYYNIEYSPNGGQSWYNIGTDGPKVPGTYTYSWDTTTVDDGPYYRIRVTVNDTGDPSLSQVDTSDANFTINNGVNPGGPRTIPGSVKGRPNPVWQGSTIWFNATIDDSNRGNSNITEAEWFVQDTKPTWVQNDTGETMNPKDGTWDSPVEDVTASTTASWAPGNYTVWIHGKDDDISPMWGSYENFTFRVIGNDIAVEPPTNVDAKLEGSFINVNITWTKSADDGVDVENYAIYRNATYNTNGVGYSFLDTVSAGTSYYVDNGAGDGNTNNYFYYVQANDTSKNTNWTGQACKFVRELPSGRQLVSVPLVQFDTTLTTVLQTIEGNYSYVQWYDPLDTTDHWKTYSTAKPSGFNDLLNVDHEMALWITMTAHDNLTATGRVPKSTAIQLYTGYNFISYASFIDRTVSDALSGLPYDQVEGFEINSPYYLKILADADTMTAGCGYWIRVTSDCIWTIEN